MSNYFCTFAKSLQHVTAAKWSAPKLVFPHQIHHCFTPNTIMKNRLSFKFMIQALALIACVALIPAGCQKEDNITPDQPADSTITPDQPNNYGYLVYHGDTLHIFAVCKTESTATNIDFSFSDQPNMLFTIFDYDFAPSANSHNVDFGVNETRSSTETDTYPGQLSTHESDGVYDIVFEGSDNRGELKLEYHGTIDNANAPVGLGTLTLDSDSAQCDLARVFSYDQTHSYLVYSNGYLNAIKITSLQPLVAGEYQLSQSAPSANAVTAQVIYFAGSYVNAKPYSGSLIVSRNGNQFHLELNGESNKGDITFSYQGTFNRQCVVDF